jgi:hypothetical protein
MSVDPADASLPLTALFEPPVKAASGRPRSYLDLDGWIDLPPISIGTVLYVVAAEVHNAIRTWRRFCRQRARQERGANVRVKVLRTTVDRKILRRSG